MRDYRYLHFVARFNGKHLSGVIDAAQGTTPIDIHDSIQLHICRKWHLSELHKDDVIVEVMRPIE